MPELCLGRVKVKDNKKLTETVRALTVEAKSLARRAAPGQFVHIRCGAEHLLRRPISICDVNGDTVSLVVEVRGAGTEWLARREPGDMLDILGPLGNGFDTGGRRLLLVGGGIGVPPLLFAAKKATGEKRAILGFQTRRRILLEEEFKNACDEVFITTDDGSAGEQGLVTAPLKRLLDRGAADSVLACGPRPMLRAVAELASQYGVPCQVSMEERMGCGIGACLVCACQTREGGELHMRHVCKDGPVFQGEAVVW
jgi:dihydroorotate dehydrogenase electron transfer subunit